MTASREHRSRFRRRLLDASGQSMVEMAVIAPFLVVVALGVVELSYGLFDQHVVTKMTREGSNLISRDSTLDEAATTLQNISTGPIDFTSRSQVIFSVLKMVSIVGATNYNHVILYQRLQKGISLGSSQFSCSCSSSDFGPAPDYVGNNSDNNGNLQVTGLPAGSLSLGGFLYITEIYSKHDLITPFNKFGFTVPNTLYSIAYF